MLNLLIVGSGGFIGSALRYLVGLGVHNLLRSTSFPYGTLVANILGCLLIGLLNGLVAERLPISPQARLFLFTGILGGFTTFSTFALDTLAMLREYAWTSLSLGALNLFAHIVVGLVAVYLGDWLARAS